MARRIAMAKARPSPGGRRQAMGRATPSSAIARQSHDNPSPSGSSTATPPGGPQWPRRPSPEGHTGPGPLGVAATPGARDSISSSYFRCIGARRFAIFGARASTSGPSMSYSYFRGGPVAEGGVTAIWASTSGAGLGRASRTPTGVRAAEGDHGGRVCRGPRPAGRAAPKARPALMPAPRRGARRASAKPAQAWSD
jgi:hypothetical protein